MNYNNVVINYDDGTPAGQAIGPSAPLPISGNVASGSADSGNAVKVGGVYAGATQPTLSAGQRGDASLDVRGNFRVTPAYLTGASSDAFTNASIGVSYPNSGNTSVIPAVAGFVFNGSSWDRLVKPNGTSRLISSAATTNATSVKASAGNAFKIVCNNTVASDRFLKFYNKASAPTVGTDTPVLTLTLPASTKNIQFDMGANGQYFSTGLAYAITALAADADTTAIAAGDITAMNITYS